MLEGWDEGGMFALDAVRLELTWTIPCGNRGPLSSPFTSAMIMYHVDGYMEVMIQERCML